MIFTHMLDGFALHEMIYDVESKAVDCRFLAVNPAFEEITGLSDADIVGRTLLEVFPGAETCWIQNYEKVAKNGQALRFECGHAPLKKIFDVQSYRPQNGQVACILRDITERKAREAEIHEMSERVQKSVAEYRELFDNALEGIFRTSTDGRLLSANPALARMLGYDSGRDLVGGWIQQIYANAEDRVKVLKQLDEQGSARGYECQARRRDGNLIWVSMNCRKILGLKGQTAYCIGLLEDITARKEAEGKLQASEDKFRMAFMTGADASSISTLEAGTILEVNDRFTELFGYSRDEACGKTADQLGCYAEFDRGRLWSALAANGRVENMEFQARRKNGEIRSVLISANLQQNNGENLLLSVVRDITGQKLADANRIQLEDQFRQAQKLESIGRLAGGIAHDFNNQLTVINGYGDLLLRACKTGDPLREWVEEIRKAGDHAVDLVRQLLAFSRKQALEPKVVRLETLIHENQSMLQRLLGEEIVLVIEADSAGWPVMADAGQLHQVLMNLAVNARDAMPRGGTLSIRIENVEVNRAGLPGHPGIAPGPYVSLRVSDTGVGISREIRDRIFDPFFTTKPEGEGTGLGLSTVYGIVRQCGGSISVSSEPGCGASFEVLLPRLQDEIAAAGEMLATGAKLGGTETVLVVEDQEPVRKLAVLALQERGYRVLDATDGAEALQLAARHNGPIHLLLTDLVMPNMTGNELADSLRRLRPEMKVLYMSGYSADVLGRRGLLESGGPFIAKPFAPNMLASMVRQLLQAQAPPPAILVVDDEAGVRNLFELVLSGAGYNVTTANDGDEALKKTRGRRFDLMLTDLVMPEREGLELILVLRKEQPELKVLAVSGAFGGTFLEAAKAMGVAGVLSKPASAAQLLAAVQEALA